MRAHKLDAQLLALVGYHARTVRRGVQLPKGALLPEMKECDVCCGPVDGSYPLCWACNSLLKEFPTELADIVVPLSYAVKGHKNLQQFYYDLHRYKAEQPSIAAQNRLKALMMMFKIHHMHCLEKAIGMPVSSVTAVPSGRNRANHPLPDIARLLTKSNGDEPEIPLIPARFAGQTRQGRAQRINPDDFVFDQELQGHVIVVEDTWVTGTNAQGLAVKARRQGAEKVSIVVLARMLDYDFPPTKKLVDTWQDSDRFDASICPVAEGGC